MIVKQLASQYIKFTDDNSLSKRILENKSITIPEKPVKIGFIKLMKPRISVKFHKLWIEITQYDPNIEINNIAKLIELECGSESKSHFNDFMINSNKYDYKIIFDPSQISDYLDINRNNGMISFVLKYQFRPDTQEKIIEEYEMKIAFDKSESQLNGDFDLSPKSKSESESASELESESDFRTGFEHRRERKIPFGSFKLINKSNYKYTNLVDCILKINFIGLADNLYNFPDDNTIQWGDINEIKETLDSFDMQGDFKEEDEDKVFSFNIKKVSKNIYDLQNILPNNEITIPAYIDLENIENPIGSAKYLAKVFMEYKFANKNDTKEKFDNFDISFIIKQDTRTTKLDTFYLDNGNHYECNSDQETKISSNLQWIKDMKGEYECFTFKLGNCAVSGDGAVYIHNFLVQFRYLDNSKNIIQTNNNESIFIIRNKNSKEINSGIDFVFQNDKESFEKITIAFRHDRIKDIPRDIVPLACNISFYYLEQDICFDNDLDLAAAITSNGIPYSHDFIFSIERNLGPYWLAVDFGTSAIVAAFDKNNDGDLSLLNLQKSLKERLIKVKQQKEYHNDNIMEFETPFLSSTIALRHQGIIHTNNINDNIILLSPTKNELLDTYLIPYMKALIGSEFLPPLDKAINEIEYYEDNNKKQLKRFKDHPIKVTNILVNTYKSLFRDYISSFIKDIKENDKNTEMNKIILTIPNTFTPRHMDYLRNLIKSEFGEFKEDYIKFISESDAAACYYVNNRSTLCSSRNLNEKKKLFDNEEYVLIYDIGAGTLDLTYLNIKQVKDIQKVTIIGRIGNHIAGNFLDYSIAKAINDIIKNDDPFTVRLFGKGDLRDMIARRKLKEIIRDSIKIKLDTNDKIKILKTDFEDGVLKQDIDIDIQQIRNNKYIKIFLNKNSKDIFKTFFNLYMNLEDRKGIKEIIQLILYF